MTVAPTRTSWESLAACRGPNATLFFPPIQGERPVERYRREGQAKQICAECPVRRACLEYALRVEEPFGIWGGLNEHERRELSASAVQ